MDVSSDALEAQKRKLEEADADASAAKRTTTTAMQVDQPATALMKNEDFSTDLLRIYYDRLFPYLQMFRWLSYKNDPKSSTPGVQKDFFLRREFCFVLEGDIFCRYTCFRDVEEFRTQVIARQPIRMEIGAVYTHPPKNHTTVVGGAYKPVEKELVFDIDMDDYDEIRTCCQGSKMCPKCWTFMKAAQRVLQRTLTEDFGFKHLLFVYSGRRGMHCWVGDKTARQLNNDHRSAVAEYMKMVAGGIGKSRADIKMNGCEELHPSIEAAYRICLKVFKEDPLGPLQGQDILRKGPHLSNILQELTVSEQNFISKYVERHPEATSLDIWGMFEKVALEREEKAKTFKQRVEMKMFLKDVVLQYTYPRLDINVSKQINHLLKSPFVVHPKTGRVCVPIDPAKMDEFDPTKVPTIGSLVDELNAGADVRHTSLREYTHFFEEKFLQPLERECVEDMSKGSLDW